MANKKQYHKRTVEHKKSIFNEIALKKLVVAFWEMVSLIATGIVKACVTISTGNVKMGEIASVSLLPILSCPGECQKTCGRFCYALKTVLLYKSVMKAYAKNTVLALKYPEIYWNDVTKAIVKNRFFRFHVSGDCPNYEYLEKLVQVASENPHCTILIFTKRHTWFNLYVSEHGGSIAKAIPENLHVMFSRETDENGNILPIINPYHFPETIVVAKGHAMPENVKVCNGNCEHCFTGCDGCIACKPGETVAFNEH